LHPDAGLFVAMSRLSLRSSSFVPRQHSQCGIWASLVLLTRFAGWVGLSERVTHLTHHTSHILRHTSRITPHFLIALYLASTVCKSNVT
jgi:hypothetical protein